MTYRTDLPSEHGESRLKPSQSHGIVAGTANKNRGPKKIYANTPPVKARTFSFSLAPNITAKIMPNDINRKGYLIQNASAFDVWVSIGSQPSSNSNGTFNDALYLPASSFLEAPAGWAPTNDIYAVSEFNATITIVETTIVR